MIAAATSYRTAANRTGGTYASPALIATNAVPQRSASKQNNPPFRYVLMNTPPSLVE